MNKGLKYLMIVCFVISSFVGKSQDVFISDTVKIIILDSVQQAAIPRYKEWPQYIEIGNHTLKNPVYIIVQDVVGKNKATAVVLTICTGFLGGHRLYLGTKPIVVAAYALTLGCVFILPFIDLVVECFSTDLSRFENNDKIFMWAK